MLQNTFMIVFLSHHYQKILIEVARTGRVPDSLAFYRLFSENAGAATEFKLNRGMVETVKAEIVVAARQKKEGGFARIPFFTKEGRQRQVKPSQRKSQSVEPQFRESTVCSQEQGGRSKN